MQLVGIEPGTSRSRVRRFTTAPQRSTIGPSVQEKKQKIDFQAGRHGGHFGFPIGTMLAFFFLHVTPMRPTKFLVNWPFG